MCKRTSRIVAAWVVVFGVCRVSVAAEAVRVACVGDSITFGAGIRDRAKNSYPVQLGVMLGEKWQVRNFGVSGATMLKKGDNPYWRQRAFKAAMEFRPNVVVIKLGTNDTKPQNWKHKAELAADCTAMAKQFAALPSKPRVWICLPVPAYAVRWGINGATIEKELIPILKGVAKETGSGVIDLHTALSGKAELFPDKIHPNAEGAKLIAQAVHRTLTGTGKAGAGFEGKKGSWQGFDRYDFVVDGRRCWIVAPKAAAKGRPWIWRARFFGHEPQTDIALLNKGFHVVYMDVANLFGAPKAVAHWNAFYAYLTGKHGFAKKAALEGMSRGGLIIYNWAAANPDKVACIYGDAPVCDFKSWPGKRGGGTWQACLKAYGLTEEQALAYKGNPIDNLAPLAKAKVPLLNICGGADKVVPVAENTAILQERYEKLGGPITVIVKDGVGHHPHSLKDPSRIVAFVLKHTGL